MYLTIDTIYNINEIPSENFDKPYLIKGGCKNMPIFKKENILNHFNESLKHVEFLTEIYDTDEEMGNTQTVNDIPILFSETIENIEKGNKYYVADVDFNEYDVSDDFKNLFLFEFDKTNKNNENILMFYGKNTLSGCHFHISGDYILNQIVGKKTVYMFDYYDNNIEFAGYFSGRNNFIKDNFFKLDHSKMKIYKVDLVPGDSLCIPPWWLHAVQGFGNTISITKTYTRNDNYYYNKPYLYGLYILMPINFFIEKLIFDIYYLLKVNILYYILIENLNIIALIIVIFVILYLKRKKIYDFYKGFK